MNKVTKVVYYTHDISQQARERRDGMAGIVQNLRMASLPHRGKLVSLSSSSCRPARIVL